MTNRTYTVSNTGGDAIITLSPNGTFYSIDDIVASYNGVPLTAGKLTVKCDGTVIFDVDIPSGGILHYDSQIVSSGSNQEVEIRVSGATGLKSKLNVKYS